MLKICVLFLILVTKECVTQEEDDGPYRGKLIGKINSYHHQVSGDVYAVDDWTILLVNFNYDGTGDDTFFWAGDAGRPGPQGFIVPNENGKTNILERYYNVDVRLTLPEGKRVSRCKWFAIYDIGSQNAFGDVYVPDDFDAPAARAVGPLAGTNAVSSKPVQVLDAHTILIPEFRYDGSGAEAYFWSGVGPQPAQHGTKIPDEYGYLEPLGPYNASDVRLELPGGMTVFDIRWLSVWDASRKTSLGSVLVPEALNVPPALLNLHQYVPSLPNCKQLHRDYQVSWEVFGNQITFELAGRVGEREYLAWGISPREGESRMLGADVAVGYYDVTTQRGLATDYNISAIAPCVQVLGQWRGVCRDVQLGALDHNQLFSARRTDGVTVLTYRRTLKPGEDMDLEWKVDAPQSVVWAVGPLDGEHEPAFHRLYPRNHVQLSLATSSNDCVKFTVGDRSTPPAWETAELFDPALRVLWFRVGPAGGARGLRGRGGRAAPALAWYVNGQLAPDLQLRRGLHYTFKVAGGSDPHSATLYHPLVVTAQQAGGLERLSDAAQRAARVLAGAHYTRRGKLAPTAAGALCVGRHAAGADRRRDDDYVTFRAYNRSLAWECAAPPADLALAPNSSWPDIVYYDSFTHAGMGGRIFIVDRHKRNIAKQSSGAVSTVAGAVTALVPCLIALITLAVRR